MTDEGCAGCASFGVGVLGGICVVVAILLELPIGVILLIGAGGSLLAIGAALFFENI